MTNYFKLQIVLLLNFTISILGKPVPLKRFDKEDIEHMLMDIDYATKEEEILSNKSQGTKTNREKEKLENEADELFPIIQSVCEEFRKIINSVHICK